MKKKIERNKYFISLLIIFLFFCGLYLKIINYKEEVPLKICPNYSKIYEELLTNYLEKYKVSVAYLDLNNNYKYSYNEEEVYYAASTVKTLSAIYLYDNNVDLNTSLIYEPKYQKGDSLIMEHYPLYSKVSLKDLIKYSIIVSDNTAYAMLVDYIGKDKLKDYGLSLGAVNTLSISDNYGRIDTHDAIIYLEKLYEIIASSPELAHFFIYSNENYFNNPVYESLAKYGFYGVYFHLIGIVLTPNPYILVILTKEGENDYEKIIKDISNKIFKLHNLNYREKNCQ